MFLSKEGVIKLPAQFKKNYSDNLARISNFSLKNRFFINIFKIWSLTDACYGLRSYERGVAQLGSAGALGALGRRFESCRPDSYSNRSQQYQKVSLKNP